MPRLLPRCSVARLAPRFLAMLLILQSLAVHRAFKSLLLKRHVLQSMQVVIMKEQRSISVPGVSFENQDEKQDDKSTAQAEMSAKEAQIRPGTLYEVLMALKERER